MHFSTTGNSQVCLVNARNNYNELTSTIRDYMRLIVSIDSLEIKVETAQYQMIRSSLFLILYNLIESTMSMLIRAVTEEINNYFIREPDDSIVHLHDKITNEILKSIKSDNSTGKSFYDYSIGVNKCPNFKISQGGGGNWNYMEIVDFSKKIGIDMDICKSAKGGYKKTIATRWNFILDAQDKKKIGSKTIHSITVYRNQLAHGEVPFHQLTKDMTVKEMKITVLKTKMFLFYLIKQYEAFIRDKQYLKTIEQVV
ncbi:MAE_28990/MAE_18760 family HEPN-like nuclease [Aeromonas hydrophila]|uniref:MAE_28990/MAE_18760 family HEPN-like nuclease n=1 Tax=Aeromonas hydrophila TaxID=644 RepID=UPI003F7AF017